MLHRYKADRVQDTSQLRKYNKRHCAFATWNPRNRSEEPPLTSRVSAR